MIGSMFAIAYTAILLLLAMVYLMRRYHVECAAFKGALARHPRIAAMTVAFVCVLFVVELLFLHGHDEDQLLYLVKWTTLAVGLLTVTVTDTHEMRIPNQVILAMLGLRACILAAEASMVSDYIKQVILYPLIGGFIGLLITLIAKIVSGKGVGMGDVKLFAVLGLYVGSKDVFSVMFWCFFVAAVAGLTLLVTKKAKPHDSMPMAPFIFIGTMIKFAFIAIGG